MDARDFVRAVDERIEIDQYAMDDHPGTALVLAAGLELLAALGVADGSTSDIELFAMAEEIRRNYRDGIS